MDFAKKLDSLIRLMNIPIEEKWENMFGKGAYNHYTYWRNMGLISADTEVDINENYVPLRSSPKIIRYFKNVDYYFPPELYGNEVVVDVGSGFGHITLWMILSGASKVISIGDPQRIEHILKWYRSGVKNNILPAGRLDTANSEDWAASSYPRCCVATKTVPQSGYENRPFVNQTLLNRTDSARACRAA